MSESRFYHVTPEGALAAAATPAEALALALSGGFAWLDFCEPSQAELEALIGPLGLHPLSVEDCLDENQIPKIEDFPSHSFILFNAFEYAGGTLAIRELDIFLGERFLVTVGGRGLDGRPLLAGIERLVALDPDGVRPGPAFLLHVVLDRIVDLKFVAIEALEERLNLAEEEMLADISRFDPAVLLHLRRDLLALRKSLFHEREILVKICRKDCPYVPEQAIYSYRDIYDHLAKFFELSESSREVVTSLMEMHLSMLNNRMARAANATNASVRRLTFITTIFMPLTLLAGIGGMSEWSMMTGPSNWRIAYPAFLAGMAVIGLANYYLLKRFERKDRKREGPPGK